MSDGISQNTQAILLLTAPLIVGRSSEGGEAPLSAGEYGRLAVDLHAMSRQPADLLSPGAEEILAATKAEIEPSRLRRLLARGFQLSQAVERWHARAIWIISRADTMYPRRLKSRLREFTPPVLYGCGHAPLLEAGGLAIVGSRDAEEELLRYTDETARRVASSREAVVSGGARGIDQTAMRAALAEGGNVSGVLSDSLERAALARENRELLMDRRLVLVSPFDPSAGFNVGHAMQRNKLVYALADAALVVSSDHNKGGTWTGAVEQLEKLHYVCVYVRSSGNTTEGIRALVKKGAVPWPEPRDAKALRAALQVQLSPRKMPPQSGLPFAEGPSKHETGSDPPPLAATVLSEVGQELFAKARDLLLRLLARPMSAEEVSRQLEVNMEQATQWLERLVETGALLRATPATYYALVRDELPATVPRRT
jgi:predicted Rossmann fold nucleotide-binding protein DprA/Smf involved in DNA uptake